MEALMWDERRGAWFDFSLLADATRTQFHPSNLAPLWAQCFSAPAMAERALLYLQVLSSVYWTRTTLYLPVS